MSILKPEYLELGPGDVIAVIYCKVCSAEIATNTGGRIKRLSNYCEAKLDMDNGSAHVTCLCKECLLQYADDRTVLQECHDADIMQMAVLVPDLSPQLLRTVLRVQVADFKQAGLP